MTPARRRSGWGASIRFNRMAVIALVCAATLPVAVLGLLVFDQVDSALAQDAVLRTEQVTEAAKAELRRAGGDLDAETGSYASWPAFQRAVASGSTTAIHDDVLAFLVGRGTVAAGVVEAGPARVAAGDPDVVTMIGSPAGGSGAGSGGAAGATAGAGGGAVVVDVPPTLYLVAARAVPAPGGAGTVGRIVLARRLDVAFATNLATLTGYAVALVAPDGSVTASTDRATTDAAVAPTARDSGVVRQGDLVARRFHLDGPSGGADVLLASRVSAFQTTAGGLPVLVLALLGTTAILALILAVVLSNALRRRLHVIHDGLAAVADGRVPPAFESGEDEIGRLAAGLDRLVATLDRRELVVRRCLAAAAVPIHLGPREAAHQLASGAADIFGARWARVVAPDESIIGVGGPDAATDPSSGAAGSAGEPGPGLHIDEAPLGLGLDGRRLELAFSDGHEWNDGDQGGLEVMGLLVGTVLDDTATYGEAAGRAARLDRLNRLQREFLRAISHNLRTPLATIELAASDLVEAGGDPFVVLRADAIRTEERRLARMVGQVLLLSRMEAGTLELEGEPVALAPLARRVIAELRLEDAATVRDGSAGSVAITDRAATEQIAWILLDNARRYAPGGAIRVEIAPVAAAHGEPMLVMAVEDEGPGVRRRDERRIFRRFERGSGSDGSEGTGLGLSVARGLARALGGDVTYRRGRVGARFEMVLPAGGPTAEEDGAPGHPAPLATDPGPGADRDR